MSAIVVSGLQKRYGTQVAVRDLTFSVPRGEIFGFVGPNGAGKTSTIRILATLLAPDGGTAVVDGIPVAEDPAGVRDAVGYMPDFFGVYDRLTAVEYLEFYAACHGVPRRMRRRRAHELLELVDLEGRGRQQVDGLSRGLKQRLCLARALVHDPHVLLLDEPAAGLDPRARVHMRELVRSLRRMGKTILVSSHILPELEELCTWVGFIDRGGMVAAGPMTEVRDRMQVVRRIRVEVADRSAGALTRSAADAASAPGVIGADVVEDAVELRLGDDAVEHEVLRWLVLNGIAVRSFGPVTGALSDAFLRLTSPEDGS
jgi:ABC-2 type transport system ATP-binding protein